MIVDVRDRKKRRRVNINPHRRRTLTVKELRNIRQTNRRLPAVLLQDLEAMDSTTWADTNDRPTTRGQCKCGPRPCPWVGCRFHLFMEESTTGRPGLVFNWPDREPWEIPQTCSLDVAEGSRTLEEVGHFLNVTRERIRQVEEVALRKVKARIQAVLALEELLKCL